MTTVKIASWWLARWDNFTTKTPGLMVEMTAPPTFTAPPQPLYTRRSSY